MGRVLLRYSDATTTDFVQDTKRIETASVRGSYHKGQQMSLDWIEELERPTMICLAGNRLTHVDLEPLSTCKTLRRIDLSENLLSQIDLSPLSHLHELAHLDLSHNRLQRLNLGPLSECTSLKWVYLQHNDFRSVNVAPLYDHSSLRGLILLSGKKAILRFDESTPEKKILAMADFAIQSLYREVERPEWLDHQAEFEATTPSLEFLVKSYGWSRVVRSLNFMGLPVKAKHDMMYQRIFFRGLGMEELVGLETGISKILDLIPQEMEWEESLGEIYDRIVDLLRAQIENSGATRDMDIEMMAGKKASVLVPLIIEKRGDEMKRLRLQRDPLGRIDISPLTKTAYGSRIVSAMELEPRVDDREFSKLRTALKEVGVSVTVERTRRTSSS